LKTICQKRGNEKGNVANKKMSTRGMENKKKNPEKKKKNSAGRNKAEAKPLLGKEGDDVTFRGATFARTTNVSKRGRILIREGKEATYGARKQRR